MDPDPEVLRQRLLVEDSELTRYCAAIVADHARRYGWSAAEALLAVTLNAAWVLRG